MKKILRTFASILLALAMLFAIPVTAFAALPEDNIVQPQWDSISSVSLDISFNGTSGNAYVIAQKQSTATRIEGRLMVCKEVSTNTWHVIEEVYGSKTVGVLGLSIDFEGEEGVRYKVIFEVTAYTGSTAETETFEKNEVC